MTRASVVERRRWFEAGWSASLSIRSSSHLEARERMATWNRSTADCEIHC